MPLHDGRSFRGEKTHPKKEQQHPPAQNPLALESFACRAVRHFQKKIRVPTGAEPAGIKIVCVPRRDAAACRFTTGVVLEAK